jgi:aminoglycoside phosphotransferase (APT) family kinase protein
VLPRSPTQLDLSPGDIAGYLDAALPGARIASAGELSGGGYAAVWKVSLCDGRDVVLKVGPPPGVRQLRYERDLMAAEASYYRTVRPLGVPVPEVLHAERDWLLVSYLHGTPLSSLDGEADVVRGELGSVMATVHGVTGEWFGYTGDRPRGGDWAEVFQAMVEDLLADAQDWGVTLPVAPRRIRACVRAAYSALAEVRRPALVHFDLWDGNVLCDGGRLSGLVDGERFLFGDPLVDFVSPAIRYPLAEVSDHPFALGYGPVVWDEAALWRLALYRMHLLLLMVVEGPSRGMTPAVQDRRAGGLLRQFRDELGDRVK